MQSPDTSHHRALRLVVAMPRYKGSGLAWDYIERVQHALLSRVRDNGNDVAICYPGFPSDYEPQGIELSKNLYGGPVLAILKNISWLRTTRVDTLFFAEHRAYDPLFILFRWFGGVRRIVVHYHHGGGATGPTTGLARFARTIRNSVPGLRADAAVCVSEFVRSKVTGTSLFPERNASVVHNAVLPERWLDQRSRLEARQRIRHSFGIAPSDVVVVCAARAALEKGIDVLFRSFDLACSDLAKLAVPLPHLVFAGDGVDMQNLKALRDQLPHGLRIHLPGRVENSLGVLAAADIAALTPRYEDAFPLFVLEAMQFGLPFIGTTRGGISESVRHGIDGFLAPSEDISQIASMIARLSTDADLRRELGGNAAMRAQREFGFEPMLKRLAHAVLG